MLKQLDTFSPDRYYYDTDTGDMYISATSVCSRILPESPFLTKWKQELGVFEANRRSKEEAAYGTLMHLVIEEFLKKENMSRIYMENLCEGYAFEKGYVDCSDKWKKRLKVDMLAFATWCHEKQVDPLAMEYRVKRKITETGGIAGTVDLKANIKFGNGPKKKARIDFKSGRKGFYPAHELQIFIYEWCDQDEEPMLLFNWSPKKWDLRKKPTYHFVNQTNSLMRLKLPHYIAIMEIEGFFNFNVSFVEFDQIDLWQPPEWENKTIQQFFYENYLETKQDEL